MNKAPAVWTEFGDVNPMDHGGGLWKKGTNEGEFEILKWEPSEDILEYGRLHVLLIDSTDSWIDPEAVCSYAGIAGIEDIDFALACIEYYGVDNFGSSVYEDLITQEQAIELVEKTTAFDAPLKLGKEMIEIPINKKDYTDMREPEDSETTLLLTKDEAKYLLRLFNKHATGEEAVLYRLKDKLMEAGA